MPRIRLSYAAVAAVTIALGLVLHMRGGAIPFPIRDALGDALWAMMIFWLLSAAWPAASRTRRAVLAVVVCFSVEFSQLFHNSSIDAVRDTTLGHLILGSDFVPADLAWYTLGVVVAARLDQLRRREPSRI